MCCMRRRISRLYVSACCCALCVVGGSLGCIDFAPGTAVPPTGDLRALSPGLFTFAMMVSFSLILHAIRHVTEKRLYAKMLLQEFTQRLHSNFLRIIMACRDKINALFPRNALSRLADLARQESIAAARNRLHQISIATASYHPQTAHSMRPKLIDERRSPRCLRDLLN